MSHTPLIVAGCLQSVDPTPTSRQSVESQESSAELSYSHQAESTHRTPASLHLQGGPIKTVHFLKYHIFAANTDIIMQFFTEAFRNYSRKQQATIVLNECKIFFAN